MNENKVKPKPGRANVKSIACSGYKFQRAQAALPCAPASTGHTAIPWACTTRCRGSSWQIFRCARDIHLLLGAGGSLYLQIYSHNFLSFSLWSCPQGVHSCHACPTLQKALWFYNSSFYMPAKPIRHVDMRVGLLLKKQLGLLDCGCYGFCISGNCSLHRLVQIGCPRVTISQRKVCRMNLHFVPVNMLFHKVSSRLLFYCPGQSTWFLFSD